MFQIGITFPDWEVTFQPVAHFFFLSLSAPLQDNNSLFRKIRLYD